jgi:drug/metabolite transporter, DME family
MVLASAAFGTSGVLVKLIGAEVEISALALAFWRDITTFTVLLTGLAVFRRRWLRIRRADLRWLVGLGASLGIFHVFWNLAVFVNGAAVATVQQAAMPAIVTIVAWFLWRESLTWHKVVAILLTFTGTVLVSGLDVLGQVQLSAGGLLVGLGVPISYASWTLFGKKVRETYNPLTALTYGFGVAALILLPLQAFTPQPWPVPGQTLTWFAALIMLSTILPFAAYTFALGRLPASVASILAMSEIAFVAVYAYFLLGERLTPSQVLGAGLVIGGVLLLSWRRRRRVGVARGQRKVSGQDMGSGTRQA